MQLKILQWLYRFFKNIADKAIFITRKLSKDIFFFQIEDREDDVYIVTFPKSGTTWMQVIVYNLLTDGNMDFNHIYDVSPWLSNMHIKGDDPNKVNELPSPRIFKSHDRYSEYVKGFKNKIIYVYRDGKDVAWSYFHHNKNYLNPELTFDENFENHFSNTDKPLNWFIYNKEWLENKNGLNILYIAYEDLMNHFIPTLHRIAFFLNVKLTPEIIERTKLHSSFEYMKTHETKFGEVAPKKKELIYNQFIREGKAGKGQEYMSEEQIKIFEKNYKEILEPIIKNKIRESVN
ncbi:MAG: sulfotransferase domain-containing protein [Chitinophagales bacterium]|nr:sulfotransferase domain-containing protein [Chitinophagales bacterium]